jgi:hypothetical protein
MPLFLHVTIQAPHYKVVLPFLLTIFLPSHNHHRHISIFLMILMKFLKLYSQLLFFFF